MCDGGGGRRARARRAGTRFLSAVALSEIRA